MNVLQTITVKQKPHMVYYVAEPLKMTPIETNNLPAVISELVGMSIETVKPIEHVGCVLKFEVEPYKRIDPPLLYCSQVDLSEYYILWNIAITGGCRNLLSQWEAMMNNLKISKLTESEAAYLLLQMLDFKNKKVRRM